MDTLACVKRVPDTGAKIVLTDDNQSIDTSNLGFTMSPHEECALEEAIQIAEETGGETTALTLGPPEADEQLRTALAMEADEAVLLETDGDEWGPQDTAAAIAAHVESSDAEYDLLLFGNEAADTANHQVPIHVAERLDLPAVTSIKSLDVADGTAVARREVPGGEEVYELPLPAVITVKEGLNEPRYPSIRSKMQARKKPVEEVQPERAGLDQLEMVELEAPEREEGAAEILGEGPEAVDEIVRVMREEVEVL
ncbi:MAG: electron transfer flavoprotein beta subunit/FixA family protein [Halobaculum sp.]|jgi:electron transfer flavoprotein beta subunit